MLPIEIFEAQRLKNADKTALIAADGAFTYEQLDRKANRAANALIARGVRPGDRVMLLMPRDSRFIAAMLGALKAGAAFIPVDPDYPPERVRHVREDSESRLMVAEKDLPGRVDADALFAHADETPPPRPGVSANDPCYIIYTSGSTGVPKGVVLSQFGLANYVNPAPENPFAHDMAKRGCTLLSVTTVAFDLFISDVFLPLLNGQTIVFAGEEPSKNPLAMARLMTACGVDAVSITPSRMARYLDAAPYARALGSCRLLFIGGEKFPQSLLKRLRGVTRAAIYNAYGPTEITIASNVKRLEEEISVGKTLLNYRELVMDEAGNPLPDGEKGELYIGGPAIGLGYLNREALNEQKYTVIDGTRFFKSGDIAWRDASGYVHIVGRIDHQVKLHGLRIELGEIESLIGRFPGVQDAVVRVKGGGGNDFLAAYYTSSGALDEAALRDFLRTKLVPYMIPACFVRMEKFELTPNGKLDESRLPEMKTQTHAIVPPRTPVEKVLFEECSELVKSASFGVTDDFTAMGLDSLSLIELAVFVLDEYGVELRLTEMMRPGSCIESLARMIDASGNARAADAARASSPEACPIAPQQMPFTVKRPANDIYRIVTFSETIDARRLRDAIVQTVNATPYFATTFFCMDGGWRQKPGIPRMTADDVPIRDGAPSEEDRDAFCQPFDIESDVLFAFAIYAGDGETTLLMHLHHILIDHVGMKTFCDHVMAVYDDPGFVFDETRDYFDYVSELMSRQAELSRNGERLLARLVREAGRPAGQVCLTTRRGFSRRMLDLSGVRPLLEARGLSVSDLLLAAVGHAASRALKTDKLLLHHVFSGRNDARYFKTIGYFPITLPLLFRDGPDLLNRIGRDVIESIERFSPFDDQQYLRLCGKSSVRLLIVYNYMEAFGGAPEDRYHLRDMRSNARLDDAKASLITPQLEFNCLSSGDRGVVMLDYDAAVISPQDVEKLFDAVAAFLNDQAEGTAPPNV